MADNMDLTSLATLASVKGSAASETGHSRFRTSSVSAASAVKGKAGFDGFLKTFLGGSNSAGKSGKKDGFASRGRNNRESMLDITAKQGAGTTSVAGGKVQDAKAADAMEDVEDIEDTSEEDISAAARDAAQMIWEILNDQMNGGQLNGASSELVAGDVDLAAMPGAITGTGQNATANGDAVLKAVEDALSHMSNDELETFLSQILGEEVDQTIDMDSFNRMAAELDATILSVGGGEADLLASLAGAAVHGQIAAQDGAQEAQPEEMSTPAENIPAAAETTGIFGEEEVSAEEAGKYFEEFQEFIEEKLAEDPDFLSDVSSSEQGEALLKNFAQWLTDNAKVSDSKQLLEHPNKFIQSLITGISSRSGTSAAAGGETLAEKEIFNKVRESLESCLQTNTGVKASEQTANPGAVPLGAYERKLNQGIFEEAAESGLGNVTQIHNHHGAAVGPHQASSIPSLARTDSTNPAAMSTMMDQIENIERIAEAVKMANRNGVKNLTMQLTPVELGKVVLRVESRGGVVSAHLRVEQPEAVAQLGSNLAQLRENLRAAGVQLGEVTIEQRGQNETLGDFSGQRRENGENGGSERNRVHWSREKSGGIDNAVQPDKRPPGGGGIGGLNLVA